MALIRRRRPLVAALLALLYPGLGHLYLRRWLRGLLWFGLIASATAVMIPAGPLEAASGGLGGSLEAAGRAVGAMSMESRLILAGMTAMEMLDAYLLAKDGGSPEGDGCPSCGKELDADLAFCPWCTHEFE